MGCHWRSSSPPRASALDAGQIASRLGDALSVLSSGSRSAPGRQKTLARSVGAAIEWIRANNDRTAAAALGEERAAADEGVIANDGTTRRSPAPDLTRYRKGDLSC